MIPKHLRVALTILLTFGLAGFASAQSLGDKARELRAQKAQADSKKRVITNDSLGLISATRAEPAESTAPAQAAESSGEAGAAKAEKPEPTATEALKALTDEWNGKIDAVKSEIAQLEREIDVMKREDRLRISAYYGDAGTRFRDERKFAEDTRNAQAALATKEQSLREQRAKLEDLREQARRAGVPAGRIS